MIYSSLIKNFIRPKSETGFEKGVGSQAQNISITDIISEGPIYGLVDSTASVYLGGARAESTTIAAQSVSRGTLRIKLTQGSHIALISNGTIHRGAYVADLNNPTQRYLILRNGYGSTTVSCSQGVPLQSNVRAINLVSTVNFFTDDMITNPQDLIDTNFKVTPARLIGSENDGLPIEGIIYARADGTHASFQIGSGGVSTDLVALQGTYTLVVDRIVEINTIYYSGYGLTLKTAWLDDTASYAFDITSSFATTINQGDVLWPGHTLGSQFTGFVAQFRTGTLLQPPFTGVGGEGSSAISHTPTELSELEGPAGFDTELQGTSATKGFALSPEQAQEADEVRISIGYPNGLFQTREDNGGLRTNYVGYRISMAVKKFGAFDFEPPFVLVDKMIHSANTKNAINFQEIINLEPYKPYQDFKIIIKRLTENDGYGYNEDLSRSGKINNSDATITSVTTILKEVLTYPYTAMAKISFNSKQFKETPTRTYHLRGLLVNVPSNYVTREESLTGVANYNRHVITGEIQDTYQNWDGAFRTTKVYTNNPAWVFFDILSNNRYGLGAFLKASQIDRFSLYRIARYCDDLVPDGKNGYEPRFTANLYITKAADAYKIIKDVSTIFRSMIYWLDGQVFPVVDQAKDPIYNFSKSNVIEGDFAYESTGSKTRANQVIVSWNNPLNNYEIETLLVEDRQNIIETGRIIAEEAFAMGCTSEGQATRYGRWKLWTAINQTEVVSFTTSINAAFIAPGDIINIQDADRFGVRYSGRIPGSGTLTSTSIPLDSPVTLNAGSTYTLGVLIVEPAAFLAQESATILGTTYTKGQRVSGVNTEDASYNTLDGDGNPVTMSWSDYTYVDTRTVSPTVGSVTSLTVTTPFTVAPSASTIWVLQETDSDGLTLASSAKQYKILSISSSSDTNYDITAVEHYNEKFEAVDKDFSVYVGDTVLPKITPRSEVPNPRNVYTILQSSKETPGEEFSLEWLSPTEDDGSTYNQLAGYEISHNIPGYNSPISVGSGSSSYKFVRVDDGIYTLTIRTLNTLNSRSDGVKTKITVLDRFNLQSNRFPLGIPYGGVSNTSISINQSGLFRIGTEDKYQYIIKPTNKIAALITNTEQAPDTNYTQDCSGMAVVTNTGPTTSAAFIENHYYILLDASAGSTGRVKLVKYNNTSYTQAYWYDAGDGSNTSGLTTLTGTISKEAFSSKIIGDGTSFTTQCKVGELFRRADPLEVSTARITHITSDTEMTIDTAIPDAYVSQPFQTSNIFIDYINDTIIARAYRTSEGYFIEPLISINASINDGDVTIAPGTVTGTEIADETITKDNIQTGTITADQIAANTIEGANISASTTIAVYQKDEQGEIIPDTYAALDGADTTWRIYAGSPTAQQAPFRVTKGGMVVAKNLRLYKDDGTIYFDSANGFSESAIAQIAGATSSRVHNITKTLSGDLSAGDATTYQQIELTDPTDVTLSARIPVDNFSKYVSEEYFGGLTSTTSAGIDIMAYYFGAVYNRSNLKVSRDNGVTFINLDRPLKGGEIVRATVSYAGTGTKLDNVTGATQVNGSPHPTPFLFTASTHVFTFKVVAGQEFGFKIKRDGHADITFKAGVSGTNNQYSRVSPLYYIRRDPNAAEQEWYWNNVLIATSGITHNISYGGDTYTLGTYKSTESGHFDPEMEDPITYVYYEINGPGLAGVTENTTATPDLTAAALSYIPTSIKARLFRRTDPSDLSPVTLINNWTVNNITRITSGTPTAYQYIVTPTLDNAVSDATIESDLSIDIPMSGTLGAVDSQGFITLSTTTSLAAGTHVFDIEVEFVGGQAPIVEASRMIIATAPQNSTGFLVGPNGGGSTATGEGDITAVVGGDGLTGGATSGEATLSVDSTVVRTAGAQTIAGDKTFSNDVVVEGDLTVNGTTTTINAVNLAIADNMIYLNEGSTTANPDLGFAGNYNDGTYAHAGMFRDATDGRWKFFQGYTPEPDASPEINIGHASFSLADLEIKDLWVSGGQVSMPAVSTRDKYRVWNSSSYAIGMQNPISFGAINSTYAMTFQMDTTAGRGFWWGTSAHSTAQGAMALSTDGRLSVATGARIGFGTSDTVVPSEGLQVNQSIEVGAGGLTMSSETETLTSTSVMEIASFVAADFAGAKVIVSATQGTARHICELLITHDGTTAISTQYASVHTGTELATYEVSLVAGVVKLNAIGASASSTVYKTAKYLLPV